MVYINFVESAKCSEIGAFKKEQEMKMKQCDEEEDVTVLPTATATPVSSSSRARRPQPQSTSTSLEVHQTPEFVNYTPPAEGPVQPEPDTLSASAVLESKVAAERQLLQDEIATFISDMQTKGFPGVARISVTVGYKKGLRYFFLPKYAKEEKGDVVGWLYHTRDYARAIGKGPGGLSDEDYELFSNSGTTRFGITTEGDILEEYVWTNIWIPKLKVLGSVDKVADNMVSDYRWYLEQIAKRYA